MRRESFVVQSADSIRILPLARVRAYLLSAAGYVPVCKQQILRSRNRAQWAPLAQIVLAVCIRATLD